MKVPAFWLHPTVRIVAINSGHTLREEAARANACAYHLAAQQSSVHLRRRRRCTRHPLPRLLVLLLLTTKTTRTTMLMAVRLVLLLTRTDAGYEEHHGRSLPAVRIPVARSIARSFARSCMRSFARSCARRLARSTFAACTFAA